MADGQENHDEQLLSRFEKTFRLMDSTEGEAFAAFKKTRMLGEQIGLSFNKIIDMAIQEPAGVNTEALEKLVEEYKAANDQLKISEAEMLKQNDTLNTLLMHFSGKTRKGASFDVEKVKRQLASSMTDFCDMQENLAHIPAPDTATFAAHYQAETARILNASKSGVAKKGAATRLLLWTLKKLGRDVSADAVEDLRQLAQSQHRALTGQQSLAGTVGAIHQRSQDLADNMNLLLTTAAPKQRYDDMMERLKELQLVIGNKADRKALEKQVKDLEAQLEEALEAVEQAQQAPQTQGQPKQKAQAKKQQQKQPPQNDNFFDSMVNGIFGGKQQTAQKSATATADSEAAQEIAGIQFTLIQSYADISNAASALERAADEVVNRPSALRRMFSFLLPVSKQPAVKRLRKNAKKIMQQGEEIKYAVAKLESIAENFKKVAAGGKAPASSGFKPGPSPTGTGGFGF